MDRVQFIELHEQPWFPLFLRNEITDMLRFGLNLLKAYAPIAPLLQRAIDSTRSPSIVDMCSGGGGPWLHLVRKLKGDAQDFHVCLTDKYPNLSAFKNAQAGSDNHIRFYPGSVEAKNVPPALEGFRTMFTSFHHFPLGEASAIVQNAVDSRQGIGLFEITRRSPSAVILMFLWALTPFLFTPFVGPFRWSRLLCTYVVPIIPLVLLFDGVVSCLRTYGPRELLELIEKLSATEYQWEVGEYRGGFLRLPVTFLIGYPQSKRDGRSSKIAGQSRSESLGKATLLEGTRKAGEDGFAGSSIFCRPTHVFGTESSF
jgi:hypothetical protein